MGCVAGMQCGFVYLLHPMPTCQQAPLPWQRVAKSTQRETAPGRLVLPDTRGRVSMAMLTSLGSAGCRDKP